MNNKIKLVIILFISIVQMSCKEHKNSAVQSDQISVLTPAEFKEKSQNNPIIDVRTPMEFSQGYIKGVKNINYFDSNFTKQKNFFDKSKPIYVYCKTGQRSKIASEKMVQLGFKEVYDLKGGIIN